MTAPLRIVLVDDDDDVRLLLRLQIQALEGMEVVGVAADAEGALEMCRVSPPDVVVMDLLMPGQNGFEAVEALRQQMPQISIIAYTGLTGEFVRNEMQRYGVMVVTKSPDVAPLAQALRSLGSGR